MRILEWIGDDGRQGISGSERKSRRQIYLSLSQHQHGPLSMSTPRTLPVSPGESPFHSRPCAVLFTDLRTYRTAVTSFDFRGRTSSSSKLPNDGFRSLALAPYLHLFDPNFSRIFSMHKLNHAPMSCESLLCPRTFHDVILQSLTFSMSGPDSAGSILPFIRASAKPESHIYSSSSESSPPCSSSVLRSSPQQPRFRY